MYYIVGIPFKSELGTHTTGDKIEEKDARKWHALESLVNTGLLYRVHGDKGFKGLPPHVYQAVMRRKDVDALLARKSGAEPYDPPEAVKESVRLIEVEDRARKSHAEKARKHVEKTINKKHYEAVPVEKKLPPRKDRIDTKKSEAQASGSKFDPEKIRTMSNDDLKAELKKRELPTTGVKAELAQRVIDDEITKAK